MLSLLLLITSAIADIHVRLPGQDAAAAAMKRVFILNEKTKRITYVDLKRVEEGVYEGKVVVGKLPEGIPEHYRIGEVLTREDRYHSFSYREEAVDVFIDLEPIRQKLQDVRKLSEGKPKASPAPTEREVGKGVEEATGGAYKAPK